MIDDPHLGNGGQRLYVMPELSLVVAIAAGGYDAGDPSRLPATILDTVVLGADGVTMEGTTGIRP